MLDALVLLSTDEFSNEDWGKATTLTCSSCGYDT